MHRMDECTLVAHALRDYLRPFIGPVEMQFIDMSMNAGEPYSAISTSLGIAQHFSVAIPPIFIPRIQQLPGWNESDLDVLSEQFASLPTWWELAS
ncbi:hypothetical protein M2119_000614 [Aurantimicrobium minutum]|nr:hypothetical protein [Aurantimicrobium minutum]